VTWLKRTKKKHTKVVRKHMNRKVEISYHAEGYKEETQRKTLKKKTTENK
jgi:hypothetical protein